MPNLPARKNESSPLTIFEEAAVKLFVKGMKPSEIAMKKYPNDRAARKRLSSKLRRALRRPHVQVAIGQQAQDALTLGIVPVTERLVKRAKRLGKPQEVKLVMEASGFHNPRVSHEHSGDIKVTLDIPRPVKAPPVDEDVMDAEVVED